MSVLLSITPLYPTIVSLDFYMRAAYIALRNKGIWRIVAPLNRGLRWSTEPAFRDPICGDRGGVFVVSKTQPAHCGPANQILSEELKQWLRRDLGCIAGRREFLSNRYFAVDVRQLSDVVVGWRHFMGALERRDAVACLYSLAAIRDAAAVKPTGVRGAVTQLAEIMSVLSDDSPDDLASGGRLNLVINAICPVTGCRTTFFDFDAIAFVPEAADESDPLYDPLMAAPTPLVNVSSDIFGFSMFTWDHCRSRFDCEVRQLTAKERRYLFAVTAESWQRMAEQTINNFSRSVNQSLCPTRLGRGQAVLDRQSPGSRLRGNREAAIRP